MKEFLSHHRTAILALAVALGGSACSGGDTTGSSQNDGGASGGGGDSGANIGSDGGGGSVGFATTAYPILKANCVGCHGPGNAIDMSVSASDARSRLVGKQAPAGFVCATSTEQLVVAGSSAMSLLYNKISAVMPICGQPMPLGSAALSTMDQATIKNWIDQGAQP